MPELSDEQIMLLVKDGQLSELTVLFERYHLLLYNFFLKMTFDKALSQDLTQNLFYRVLRYRGSYRGAPNSFRPWLYQMARNVHIDHHRQQQRIPGNPGSSELEDKDTPDQQTGYTEEQFEKLDQALAQLEPDHREILVLSRYQGLKYEEISLIKGVSVSAIKVQVHRTLKQLRRYYFERM